MSLPKLDVSDVESDEELVSVIQWALKTLQKRGNIRRTDRDRITTFLHYRDWEIAGKSDKFSRQRLFLVKKFGKCAFCGSKENLTQDHIYPKSRGGSNGLKNKQLLCQPCNNKKGNTIPANPVAGSIAS